jgi:spore maturation protein CgeB
MSTSDVCIGLTSGLRSRGHEIFEYALDKRIECSGAWLTYCWRKGGKTLPKPNPSDIVYHAGEELIARALRVMPDVVLVVSAMYLHPDIFVLMQRAGLPVAVLFTESPYDDERQARLLPFIRLAWTNEKTSAGEKAKYLPHAWNPDIHGLSDPIPDDVPSHDVVFVGTGFEERIELLSAVDWTGIDLGLYGSWDLLGSRHHLREYLKGGYVSNARANHLYRKARIGLNLYRQSKGFGRGAPRIDVAAESLNPRAYELAASGCFTISDHRSEVSEVFADLVPTFTASEEVRPLIDRWLSDESGLARVRAMLPLAVAQHTWHARAVQIESDLHGVGIGTSRAQTEARVPLPAALA